MSDDLGGRVERLEGEIAVRRLIDRYVDACDRDDATGVASLFASDGTLQVRGTSYRGAEIVEFYSRGLQVPSLHFTTGLRITTRSDELVATTCGFAAIEMPDDGWRLVTGRYRDLVRIDAGEGRFVEREITIFGRRSLTG